MIGEDLRFVHFSDTHIVGPGVRLRDVDTCRTLAQVIDAVNGLAPPPAFVLIGGDLVSPDLHPEVKSGARKVTDEDYESAYALLRELLGRLTAPIHVLLGNHDRRGPFRRVGLGERTAEEQPYHYVIDADGYRLCALDSLVPGEDPGRVGDRQLAWLADRLHEAAGRHVLIAVHHHPVPIGVRWLDDQMLTDAEALWRLAREAGNVRAVLCGHVHLEHEAVRDGVRVLITPSTCFQVDKRSQERRYLDGPPAVRVVSCRGGRITSEVLPVEANR